MKNTVSTLLSQKQSGDKITMLTAYDFTTARIMDECGVNAILIGDSLGMVMLGYDPPYCCRFKRRSERFHRR